MFFQSFSQSPPDDDVHDQQQQQLNQDQYQPVNPSHIFHQKQPRGPTRGPTIKPETEINFSPSVTSPAPTC